MPGAERVGNHEQFGLVLGEQAGSHRGPEVLEHIGQVVYRVPFIVSVAP